MAELSKLPESRLEDMAEAGKRIVECYRQLEAKDSNVVAEILRDQGAFFEWDHYPLGDVYDPESHAQYYYHAHPPEERAADLGAEHGHFHTFLRAKGMPETAKPAPVPDDGTGPDGDTELLTHFVAVSMDPAGFPIRLFTTNRWVTGETWYAAGTVASLLDRFRIGHDRPSGTVNTWITAMLSLFRPDIEVLLAERDHAVETWQRDHPGNNVYEDRDLEIASFRDISVEEQVARVEAALAAK